MAAITPSRRTLRTALVATATLGALIGALLIPQTATADPVIAPPDGLSEATAAASCWEIKQLNPTAPSGIYWIATPTLGAADQYYCDQDTNGGGWVLIGRGREGWTDTTAGHGTSAQVRSVITGQAAFTPQELSAKVIGGLLNGGSVNALSDGIRLRRATAIDGSTWQESRFAISSPRTDWSWAFDNQQRVGSWTIGTATGSGGNTNNFGSGNTTSIISTTSGAAQGWEAGFGFGTSSRGTTDASSYIWAPSTSAGNPRPFTQVYLRPKIMSSSFTAIPDSGTAKQEQAPIAESAALPTVWGVAGLGAGPNNIEGANEVSAFAEGNGIVYVGGNFLTVQKSAAGASQVAQSYLAAFNVNTGEWISSFRPTFNKQVKSLAVLPNGDVAVGGYFDVVNGVSHPAFVVLNPTTGATDTSFTTQLVNKVSGSIPIVRAMDVQGNWLYIGGDFTHLTGGTATNEVYARDATRISVTNGTPDGTWNPEFNGTVVSLDASSQGDRVYFAGFFSQSKTTSTVKGAVITTDNASVIPWNINFSAAANYQQAVKEVGNRVWIAGSEHMMFSYDRTTMNELSTTILGSTGGDGQAISTDGTNVYAGCHCFWTEYTGARYWPSIGTDWTSANKINSFGAWNNATGLYEATFNPSVSQRHGAGSWAIFNDSTGVTWTGGDYSASVKSGSANQWSGGFVRFAANDSVAPTSPTALTVTTNPTNVSLSWSGSTDNKGSVTYQVLRNDRVVATTTGLTVTLPLAPADTKYFVRAADPSGNWSASTPAVKAVTSTPATNPVLIAAASTWNYSFSATAPAAGWQATGFDSSAWSTGAAPLGFGQASLGTTLTAPAPLPVTSYYRKAFTVVDASKVASVTLTTRADDGIVVYVNGVEVNRTNMDAGAVTSTTNANVAVSAANALANPVTITVPGSAFTSGTNVISAEVHSNYKSTPSHSFELTATATFGTQPVPPPVVTPPAAPAALVAAGSNWQYVFDGNAPAAGWNATAFDSSTWTTGAAPLGFGQAALGTTLTTAITPKPLTAYYRTSFTVADPSSLTTVKVTTRADDGIVLYLNGVELTRVNIDPGAVTVGTAANKAVNAADAVNNLVVLNVPASAFTAGTNVFAAEVHSNYRSTPSNSFELTAIPN
jgi:hypothetical protein